jgi:hypothetical protein
MWASAGSWGEAGGVVTWTGTVYTTEPITVSFGVTLGAQITTPQIIALTALIDDGLGIVWRRHAAVVANGIPVYLPLACRH